MPAQQFNETTGLWEEAIPVRYPAPLLEWIWLRLTGWRDHWGRKPELMWPWE